MATKKSTRQQRRSRAQDPQKPRRPRPAHLLVLECDAPRLDAQRLSLGTVMVQHLKQLFPGKDIELLRTSTHENLVADFGCITDKHSRFNTILVVGHSNSQGLQLADEAFSEWSVVAKWLAHFEPKTIVLVACQGGRFAGVKALFDRVKTLRNVYASPVQLGMQQTGPLILATIAFLNGERITRDVKSAVQTVAFVATGGIIYHWQRQEVLKTGNVQAHVWNVLADVLDALPR